MTVTHYYCDRCGEELHSFPPCETSAIKITSEVENKIIRASGPLGMASIEKQYLFGFEEKELWLCHKCGLRFKKYLNQFLNETKVNIT